MLDIKKINLESYPQLEVDASDQSLIAYRLLYPFLSQSVSVDQGKSTYYKCNPIYSPFIFCGPEDVTNDTHIANVTKWKIGPVCFLWNEAEKVWTAALNIHHHLDNTIQEGGIAHAYFFR